MAEDRMLSDEILLALIKKNSGGGGGGTGDYNDLSNQPQVNGNTLIGDKTAHDLGLASEQDVKVKDVKVDNASCVDENGNAVVVIKKPLTGKVYKFSTPSMEYTRVQTYRDDELLSTVDYWYRDVYRNPVTVDDVFTLTYPNSTNWYVTLLVDVIDHSAGDVFYWAFGATPSIAELDCIASILDVELSAAYTELNNAIKYNEDAIDTIKDGQNINSFAGVETALSNKQNTLTFDDTPTDNSTNPVKSGGVYAALAAKQDALTAGDYIDITNNEISVNREIPANNYSYEIVTKSTGGNDDSVTIKKYANGTLVSSTDYIYNQTGTVNVDGYFTFQWVSGWRYTLLQASTTHAEGYTANWSYLDVVDITEVFPTEDTSGLKLIIKSELDAALATKQNATDDNLDTDAKTIVGAINEHEGDIESLNSGLTNLDTEVNGDATVYPYADVITIEDAIPANVADCNVKIEPVQDLHGYDHPWVGGAGKNKINIADKASSTSGDVTASCSNGVITLSGTASAQTTFSFPLGSDINLTPSLYKIAYNNTAASSYIAVKFCNDGSVIHSWTPNVVNRVISDWTAAEDETIDEIKIEIATGYPTNMTLSIVVMDKDGTDTSYEPYSNICPISGHTEASVQRDGKNILDLTTYTNNKYLNASGVETEGTSYAISDYLNVDKSLQYSASGLGSVNGTYACFYDDSKAFISSSAESNDPFTFTTPSNARYVRVTLRNVSALTAPQVELGSSAIDYEPYQGKTYTIALGDTIYGGTVDFKTGVMTVTHVVSEYDGSEDEEWKRQVTQEGNNFFYIAQNDMLASSVILSNEFPFVSILVENDNIGVYSISNSKAVRVRYAIDNTLTVSDMRTWLSNNHLQLFYELETAITVQLTPQQIQLLKGTNTIYTSTGQISVTVNGVSGAIGQVQEQVNELAEEIANVKPVNYSTTPQKTGQKWIDGRDVYMVVLPFDATSGSASIDVTSLNIDIAFCVGCFCQEELYQTYNLAITQLYNTADDKFTFQMNGARTAINVSVGNEKKGHGAIILCYTESVGN